MEVKVYGEHHLEVTPAMQEHAMKHMDKFKNLMHDCVIEIRLSSKENKTFGAKFNIHYKGHDIHVEKTSNDMYKAINDAREAALKSAHNVKEKMNKRT